MTIDAVRPESVEGETVARVGGSLIWGQLLRIVEVGTSILFLATVVRKLGPGQYGLFGLAMSITSMVNMIGVFGFSEALSKYLPEITARDGRGAAAFAALRVLMVSLLWTAVLCVGLWVIHRDVARWLSSSKISALWPAIVALIACQTTFVVVAAVCVGMWRLKIVCLISSMSNVLAALAAIALVWLRSASAASAVNGTLLAFALGAAAYVAVSGDWILGARGHRVTMAPIWRFAGWAWLSRLSVFIIGGNVAVILISRLLGSDEEVGYFNCAYVPIFRVQALILGWTISALPSFSELRATRGEASALAAYRLYVKLAVALAVPIFAFVACYAEPMVMGVFGKAFQPAGALLRIYSLLSLVALLAGSGMTTLLLYSLDKTRLVVALRLGVAAAYLAGVYLLITAYGTLGCVVAVGLAAVVAALLELIIAPKTALRVYPFDFAGKALVLSGLALAVTRLFPSATLWDLALSGTVFLVAYTLALSRWKPLDAHERKALSGRGYISKVVSYLGS